MYVNNTSIDRVRREISKIHDFYTSQKVVGSPTGRQMHPMPMTYSFFFLGEKVTQSG